MKTSARKNLMLIYFYHHLKKTHIFQKVSMLQYSGQEAVKHFLMQCKNVLKKLKYLI